MMEWSKEHRVFIVESYFSNGKSVIVALRKFRQHFKMKTFDTVPNRKTVIRWVTKFRTEGTLTKSKRVSPRKVRTPENIEVVKQSVQRSPFRSARKHALALGISEPTVRKILHEDLGFHPFKIAIAQELLPRDYENRRYCCNQMLAKIAEDDVLITTDEAHFYLSGAINKQNYRHWSADNPKLIHQKPLHSQKVTVWCAVSKFGVWGPYFFEDSLKVVTVTSERYVKMLLEFVKPKLRELHIDSKIWFQQDGATAHTARLSLTVLQEMFPGRVVSLRGDVPWPARSPDLSPCDFFLWGHLKAEVFKSRPITLTELKAAIVTAVNEISMGMINRVMDNFRDRLQKCVLCGGGHLKDIIFRN